MSQDGGTTSASLTGGSAYVDRIWIATVVYALLLFGIAGWWGRRRPEWHGWAWVDVPY